MWHGGRMTQDAPLPRGINHIGLTVPDLDAATLLRDGLGARVAYDGLTLDDDPREGEETERQLGLPTGARIRRQRMVVAGHGPSLELFEIDAPHQQAAGLADHGLNHLSFYTDDSEAEVWTPPAR